MLAMPASLGLPVAFRRAGLPGPPCPRGVCCVV